jgi:hypothetical protein
MQIQKSANSRWWRSRYAMTPSCASSKACPPILSASSSAACLHLPALSPPPCFPFANHPDIAPNHHGPNDTSTAIWLLQLQLWTVHVSLDNFHLHVVPSLSDSQSFYSSYYGSNWDRWGRWVLLGAVILAALLVFFLCGYVLYILESFSSQKGGRQTNPSVAAAAPVSAESKARGPCTALAGLRLPLLRATVR